MHKITDQLWLGDMYDGRDFPLLQDNGIRGIVNVAIEVDSGLAYAQHDIIYAKAPLDDAEGNTPEEYYAAIVTLNNMVKRRSPVLVHCGMGISRAPFIAAAWLVATDKGGSMTLDGYLNYIASMRSQVDPYRAHLNAHKLFDHYHVRKACGNV